MARRPQGSRCFQAHKGHRSDQREETRSDRHRKPPTTPPIHIADRRRLRNGSTSAPTSTSTGRQSKQKMHDVICINDDSGSSESLPQLNNVSSLQQHRKYKPAVINISDGSNDSGSSESLPQLNNVISLQQHSKYKPAVINIGDGSGSSHHRKKASKDKQKKHTSHAPAIKPIKPKKAGRKTYIIREPGTIYFRSFDDHCTWGNKVKLCKDQVRKLKRLIAAKKSHINCYICHMSLQVPMEVYHASIMRQ